MRRGRIRLRNHQYIERSSGLICDEKLFGDRILSFLYSNVREHAPTLFQLLIQNRVSKWLAWANFDAPLGPALFGNKRFLRSCGVNLNECLENPHNFRTPREIFERKIRYWQCRPIPEEAGVAVSPADARVLVGSLRADHLLFLKEKFFHYEELVGSHVPWVENFRDGDFAIFRLTPDKYHYNHTPVTGAVIDFYELAGEYHSCNPSAVIELATPYSKNRRTVTIVETDVRDGSEVGLVAMVEITALMVGDVVQAYSEREYDSPVAVQPGMFVRKGCPKSIFRPGSSTVVLLFQEGRVEFYEDLIRNMRQLHVQSRFSMGFHQPLVETDIQVRSPFARRITRIGGKTS